MLIAKFGTKEETNLMESFHRQKKNTSEAIEGADVFLGLSSKSILSKKW